MVTPDHEVLFAAFVGSWYGAGCRAAPYLADWYEDAGESDLAHAVRWMDANDKRPRWADGLFEWWDADRLYRQQDPDPQSTLPGDVFRSMKIRVLECDSNFGTDPDDRPEVEEWPEELIFESPLEALAALAAGLDAMRRP